MDTDNTQLKRSLFLQSFAPLFFLLSIKYCDIGLYWELAKLVPGEVMKNGLYTIITVIKHPAFGGLVISAISIVWLLLTVFIALGFKAVQDGGFRSAGEMIIIAENQNDGSASFMVTYILPLFISDVDSWRDLLVFLVMLAIIMTLLKGTKTFYQNPILTILKYKTFTFKFLNPDSDIEKPDGVYTGITRGAGIAEEATIKRKHISDGVFLIFND